MTAGQSNLVPDGDFATRDHKAIERELALEAPVNVAGDLFVLGQRIGIERRHDAAIAQVLNADPHSTNVQAPTRPLALGHSRHTADDDIRPQPTQVVAEGCDGAIGGHQQRQDVETLGSLITNELRSRTGNRCGLGGGFRAVPWQTIDERIAKWTQGTFVAQESWMRARGEHLPAASSTCTIRSPSIPSGPTFTRESFSPAIVLTGYRQISAIHMAASVAIGSQRKPESDNCNESGKASKEDAMADDHTLPGWPKKKLVKDVRRSLSHYGIRPVRSAAWRAAWTWADAIARSYYQTHWPLASEIATLYIHLLLAELKRASALKLPFRAGDIIPPEVAAMLPSIQTDGSLALVGQPQKRSRQSRRPVVGESPA